MCGSLHSRWWMTFNHSLSLNISFLFSQKLLIIKLYETNLLVESLTAFLLLFFFYCLLQSVPCDNRESEREKKRIAPNNKNKQITVSATSINHQCWMSAQTIEQNKSWCSVRRINKQATSVCICLYVINKMLLCVHISYSFFPIFCLFILFYTLALVHWLYFSSNCCFTSISFSFELCSLCFASIETLTQTQCIPTYLSLLLFALDIELTKLVY